MNKLYVNKNQCSGCGACEQICPQKAIFMKKDSEGFLYPVIDKNKCIDCGLCKKVCQFNIEKEKSSNTVAYAFINNNDTIRKNSSSGGVFFELAKYVISKNGVVFGCHFDDNLKVIHSYSRNMLECEKFQSSKYVQSNVLNTYSEVKNFLCENKLVLYTGTPCQIVGLNLFLNKKYENLITVDLVCHGAPSPKIFDKYINELQESYKSKIKKFNFRDKSTGWNSYSYAILFENGNKLIEGHNKNPYSKLFLSNTILRPSCYNCVCVGINRTSDITLADFWGVSDKYNEMYDNKGTSLILVHSDEGRKLLKILKLKSKLMKVDIEYAVKHNISAIESSKIPKNRKQVFRMVDSKSIEFLSHRYVDNLNFIKKIFTKFINIIKKIIK